MWSPVLRAEVEISHLWSKCADNWSMTFIPIRLMKEYKSELIICNLWYFVDAVKGQNILIVVPINWWLVRAHWKLYGRKQWDRSLRHYTGINLEQLSETPNNLSQDSRLPTFRKGNKFSDHSTTTFGVVKSV